MTIEIETAPLPDETKEETIARATAAEREFKKDSLAQSLGVTRRKFDDMLEDAKQFFELNKKEIKEAMDNRSRDETKAP